MKKTQQRSNMRKLNADPLQHKTQHSQSPTHKKLLKKIESIQRDPSKQYEISLQDNVAFQKPQEGIVDFRVEIERRFQKSMANHMYIFPTRSESHHKDLDQLISPEDSSCESLRHVTVYDLSSQNKRKNRVAKQISVAQDEYVITGNDDEIFSSNEDSRIHTEPNEVEDSRDRESQVEQSETPIEIKIRDKSSETYKRLIRLLEKQLNNVQDSFEEVKAPKQAPGSKLKHHEEVIDVEMFQRQIKAKVRKGDREKRTSANPYTKKSQLKKNESQRSIGYHIGRVRVGDSDYQGFEKTDSAFSYQGGREKIQRKLKDSRVSDAAQRFKIGQNHEKINSYVDSSQNAGDSGFSLDHKTSPSVKRYELIWSI